MRFGSRRVLTGQMLRLCHDASATPFMALIAVFGLLLCRYQPQQRRDVVIGVPFDGRFDRRLGDLIGMFINTLAVRVRCPSDSSFRKLLACVRDSLLEAYCNADVPFDWVVREVAPGRDLTQNPLFRVMFQVQHADGGCIRIGDLDGTWFMPAAQPAKFDITLSAVLSGRELDCEMTYSTALFDRQTITLLADQYQELLASVAADPDRKVGMLLPHDETTATDDKPTAESTGSSRQSIHQSRPPSTELEALLCGIFADTLGRAEIAVRDQLLGIGRPVLGQDLRIGRPADHRADRRDVVHRLGPPLARQPQDLLNAKDVDRPDPVVRVHEVDLRADVVDHVDARG